MNRFFDFLSSTVASIRSGTTSLIDFDFENSIVNIRATVFKVAGVTLPSGAVLGALVSGLAGGYKISRSAAPVALDGSNPTSVPHGLTTCVAVFVQLVGSVAPGSSTSVLTAVINGTNIDVYAWKPTGAALTDLVASTGTETFNWFAIGT